MSFLLATNMFSDVKSELVSRSQKYASSNVDWKFRKTAYSKITSYETNDDGGKGAPLLTLNNQNISVYGTTQRQGAILQSIDVTSDGYRGTYNRCTINIQVLSRNTLEIYIDKMLRPGLTLDVEFGWSVNTGNVNKSTWEFTISNFTFNSNADETYTCTISGIGKSTSTLSLSADLIFNSTNPTGEDNKSYLPAGLAYSFKSLIDSYEQIETDAKNTPTQFDQSRFTILDYGYELGNRTEQIPVIVMSIPKTYSRYSVDEREFHGFIYLDDFIKILNLNIDLYDSSKHIYIDDINANCKTIKMPEFTDYGLNINKFMIPTINVLLNQATKLTTAQPGNAKATKVTLYGPTKPIIDGQNMVATAIADGNIDVPTRYNNFKQARGIKDILVNIKYLYECLNEVKATKGTDFAVKMGNVLETIFRDLAAESGNMIQCSLIPKYSKTKVESGLYVVNENSDTTEFDQVKNNIVEIKAYGPGSICRSFTVNGSVPSSLQTTIIAGGGGSNIIKGSGNLSQTKLDTITNAKTNFETAKTLTVNDDNKVIVSLDSVYSALKSIYTATYDYTTTSKLSGSTTVSSLFDMKKVQFPITLSVVLDGINGIIYGNPFTIDALPPSYLKKNGKCYFSVIKINHQVSGGDWVTNIEGQYTLV